MLSNNTEYIQNVNNKLFHDKNYGMLALSHRLFLEKLRFLYNFIPEVCYDIGSCLLHWTKHAEYVWPQTKIYLFPNLPNRRKNLLLKEPDPYTWITMKLNIRGKENVVY
jgi:hypothetical protein